MTHRLISRRGGAAGHTSSPALSAALRGARLVTLAVVALASAALTGDEPSVASDVDRGHFYVPLMCGTHALVSQGNHGEFSHTKRAQYAFDFSVDRGTPILAMAEGTVIHVYDKTGPEHPCYNGGDASCFPHANLVVLLHADGSTTAYKHLDAVRVQLGDQVARGTIVGLSGSTGFSTGPHAHIMRQANCGAPNCDSLPLVFADVDGNGVPETDDVVTSKNCPPRVLTAQAPADEAGDAPAAEADPQTAHGGQ